MKDEKHIAKQAHILSECQGAENPFAFSKFIYVTSVMFFKGKELGGREVQRNDGGNSSYPWSSLVSRTKKN